MKAIRQYGLLLDINHCFTLRMIIPLQFLYITALCEQEGKKQQASSLARSLLRCVWQRAAQELISWQWFVGEQHQQAAADWSMKTITSIPHSLTLIGWINVFVLRLIWMNSSKWQWKQVNIHLRSSLDSKRGGEGALLFPPPTVWEPLCSTPSSYIRW